MYKVLIADDEAIIRGGLARFVESDPEFRVVATAEDGRAALALAREHRPDLALVDINMPFINGIALTEQLVAMLPDIVIVIISGYDDFSYAQNALRLGVLDYILKPVMEDDFSACCGERRSGSPNRAGGSAISAGRETRWSGTSRR